MDNLINIFSQILFSLSDVVGSIGWAIVVFTIVIRSLLLPLAVPAIKAGKKIKDIKPEIEKLKKKFGNNKEEFNKAQLELYKKYNINPVAGCLPQLAQVFMLIVLYRSLMQFLEQPVANGSLTNTSFLWFDLTKPDGKFILPILAGLTQFILSLMVAPGAEVRDIEPNLAKQKKTQVKNKQEEDMAEMAATMQQQMLFLMPIMTGFIAVKFPAGLSLYWVISTIFSIVQQLLLSGPGGLTTYFQRLKLIIKRKI